MSIEYNMASLRNRNNLQITFFQLTQYSPFLDTCIHSATLRQALTNYVTLLWAAIGQLCPNM
jgi:hypothetical protein